MGLKIRDLIQNQGVLGNGGLLIGVCVIRLRGIVKIMSFKTTFFRFFVLICVYALKSLNASGSLYLYFH